MGEKVIIVIEHLEPILSKWLLIEYKHASQIAKGNLIITNVCRKDEVSILEKIAKIRCESASELFPKAIVLDPSSNELLSPSDRELSDVFVIGGILGDHPPRGRTKALLTSKFSNPITRSLGDGQYSIDGAVYVTYKVVFEGVRLNDIPYIDGIRVLSKAGIIEHEIYLPFRYPLVNGKPLIHPELLEYLKGRIIVDEQKLLRNEE